MLRIKLLLLSVLILACLAEDTTKQPKSDSKDKSVKDATTTHKPAMDHDVSQAMSNHSASDAGMIPDMPKIDKSPEAKNDDMKSSATVGLGFYAGVLPIGYPSYSAYPYYRSYYARPYWGYSYRPTPVVIRQPVFRPRPIPVLLG